MDELDEILEECGLNESYEDYVIKTPEGNLTVSDIILWNEYCHYNWFNISTGEKADEENIFNFY